jgi:DnaK suppressor protein
MQMKGDALVRIDEALARINEGRYGLCESCGAEISEARLNAMPFALRCTHCEERKEDAEEAQRHEAKLMHRLRWEG